MGSSQAASKLILMEADARNSIIESMAPRAAANTLTSMEDAMQAICAQSEPGSPEVRRLAPHAKPLGTDRALRPPWRRLMLSPLPHRSRPLRFCLESAKP